MKTFLKKYPDITFAIDTGSSEEIENSVADGKSDVGFIAGQCKRPSLKSKLVFRTNKMIMVYSPSYFLAKKTKVTPKDISEALLIWHSDSRSRTTRLCCKKLGIEFHGGKGTMFLSDMESSKKHALLGIGATFIASAYVQEELKNGKLVALPKFSLDRPLYMINRNDKYESPHQKIFKDEYVKYCVRNDG